MTNTKRLTDNLSVSAFVRPAELRTLTPQFGTIINNRPDGEEPGQPTSAEIEAEARRLGLGYVSLPVVAGQITDQQVAAFSKALSECDLPVLAFCRTGTRSTMLWALSQAGKRNADDILKTAAAAGYDLSGLRPRLEETAKTA